MKGRKRLGTPTSGRHSGPKARGRRAARRPGRRRSGSVPSARLHRERTIPQVGAVPCAARSRSACRPEVGVPSRRRHRGAFGRPARRRSAWIHSNCAAPVVQSVGEVRYPGAPSGDRSERELESSPWRNAPGTAEPVSLPFRYALRERTHPAGFGAVNTCADAVAQRVPTGGRRSKPGGVHRGAGPTR